MSWNKNTINSSNILYLARALSENGVKIELYKVGEVAADGLNDGGRGSYPIYLLITPKKTYLDVMERDYDCDFDDIIYTHEIPLNDNLGIQVIEFFRRDEFNPYKTVQIMPDRQKWKRVDI